MDLARTTFVVNPCSAGGKTGRRWPQREQAMRALFPQAEVQFTHAPKDAVRITSDAQARGQQLVVAVGGDGTVHEVVNGLMRGDGERATLGILPSGTGSDFARGLGIGPSFEQALDQLAEGKSRRIDLGRVESPNDPARTEWFGNVASLGVTGEVVRRVNKSRKWFGSKPTYLWASVGALMRYRNARVRWSLDNSVAEDRRIKAIAIGNSSYFGGGMCIAPDARPDSGDFQVAIFGDLGRFEAIRRLGETYFGTRIEHADIYYHTAKRIEIESATTRAVEVELDGEAWGPLPARVAIEPAALRVISPRRAVR
ncbi:MAG: diacylglycerol kinase family lipid kinase [Planctomycetes bacterium]|nr:diacylglycerol kinase family lipid kinase [Planctomycetota bacterium]